MNVLVVVMFILRLEWVNSILCVLCVVCEFMMFVIVSMCVLCLCVRCMVVSVFVVLFDCEMLMMRLFLLMIGL